jgi:hypothetical protein
LQPAPRHAVTAASAPVVGRALAALKSPGAYSPTELIY